MSASLDRVFSGLAVGVTAYEDLQNGTDLADGFPRRRG